MQMNYWSKEEVWILREHYSKMGSTALMEMLPGRSAKSIKAQACKQGLRVCRSASESLKREPGAPEIYLPWTQRDINLLKSLYPIYGGQGLTDVFPERNQKSIRRKANELGLKLDAQIRTERNRELARMQNEPEVQAKDFSEYEKVSSIFSVGRRCQALFDGGFVQGD